MKFSLSSSRARSLATLFGVLGSGYLLAGCSAEDPVDNGAVAATQTPTGGTGSAPTTPVTSTPGTSPDPSTSSTTLPPNPSTTTAPTTAVVPTTEPSSSATTPATSTPPTPSVTGTEQGGGGAPSVPTTEPTATGTAPTSTAPVGPPPDETNADHCLYGYDPHPTDATMASGPALYTAGGGEPDTILQPEVLQWMADNKWTGAHVVWHAVRACASGAAGGLLGPLGFPDICNDYPFLVPTDQNCRTAGDGYQFLLFHRHMIETLKQLWPTHAEDFDGFDKFPTTAEELPEVWNENAPTWNAEVLETADIADNIEDHLDKFPDEGSLGFWLQCAPGTRAPSFAPDMPYIGLHFNLHDQWTRGASSDHGLNNGQVNITNYMFWKLHGWIDKVWEKYRVAKGITEDPVAMQKYKADLAAQCREMDMESQILQENPGEGPMFDCPPEVDETGDFHTKVRPILENDANHCAGCHGPAQTSPYAGLTLGGHISSACVVERLKRESISGGQYSLVVPGDPENSWLYLKAAGLADAAGCVDTDTNACNTAAMPPGGRTMTDEELQVLYDWIAAGAN